MGPYYQDDSCTIYHGDALEVVPWLPTVDAVVTDPPFKLTQEYSANADPDNLEAVASLWPLMPGIYAVAAPGALMAMFYDTRILPFALRTAKDAGWKYLRGLTFYRRWGTAHKLAGWMSTSDFVLVFAKPGAPFQFHGSWRHDVYIKDHPEPVAFGHPAQKPSDACSHLVSNVTPPGGTLLDPYAGSGSLLVAAKKCGRNAIGIEIEERYCEIAAKRLSQEVLALA